MRLTIPSAQKPRPLYLYLLVLFVFVLRFIFVCAYMAIAPARPMLSSWQPTCPPLAGWLALWHKCGTTRRSSSLVKSATLRCFLQHTSRLEQQARVQCCYPDSSLPASVYITAGSLHHDEFPSRRSSHYNMQVIRVKMMRR